MRTPWQTIGRSFAADLRTLALVRMLIAVVILADCLIRVVDATAHYSDLGLLPRAALFDLRWSQAWLSLHVVSGLAWVQVVLLGVCGLSAVALLLGYRTRLATVICWVLIVSVQNRNPMILTGGDTLLRALLFWACFMPWGTIWSLDAGIARCRSESGDDARSAVVDNFQVQSVGAAGWLLQIILVHEFAAILKTGADWWSEGSALYYALSLDQLQAPLGSLLVGAPALLLMLGTWSALALEFLAPLLLLVTARGGKIRALAALAIILFHVALILTMRLGIFPWVNLIGALAWMPAWFWQWPGVRALPLRFDALFARLSRRCIRIAWLARHAGPPTTCLALPRWQRAVVGLLIAYVVVWNLTTIKPRPFDLPAPIVELGQRTSWIGYTLRLDQTWNLFAPRPFRDDGWYVMPGRLRSGEEVDVYRGGTAVSFKKPEDISQDFRTYRWRKYMRNLWLRRKSRHLYYYGEYLCRAWNSTHEGDEQLVEFEIYYIKEVTPKPGEIGAAERVRIWSHLCLEAEAQPDDAQWEDE